MPVPPSLTAVIAHRGASAHAPENTLPAFTLALEQGADGIEFDVQLSKDGQVVVIHDHDLARTTDGQVKVNATTLTDLKKLDAGGWFGPEFQAAQIPTLTETLETIGKGTLINIELKNLASPFDDLPQKTAEIISRLAFQEHVIVSSFNPLALAAFRRALPSVPVGLLILPGKLGTLTSLLVGPFIPYHNLHPHFASVTPQLAARLRRKHRGIYTYTVNRPEDLKAMFALGVSGIITDDPVKALAVRAEALA